MSPRRENYTSKSAQTKHTFVTALPGSSTPILRQVILCLTTATLWCSAACDDIQIDYNIGIQSYFTKYKLDIDKVENLTGLDCEGGVVYHETAQEQRSMALSHGAPLSSQYLDIPDCFEDIVGGATVGLLCGPSFFLFDINTWKLIGSIELTGEHKGRFVASAQYGYTTALISVSEDRKHWWLSFVNSFDSVFKKTSIGGDIENPDSAITVKYIGTEREMAPEETLLQIIIYETPLITAESHQQALGSYQVHAIGADATGVPIPSFLTKFPIRDLDRVQNGEIISLVEIFYWNQTRYAFHRYFAKEQEGAGILLVQVCPPNSDSCDLGAPSRQVKFDYPENNAFYNIDMTSVNMYHIMDNWILFIATRVNQNHPIIFMCSLLPENATVETKTPLLLHCSKITEVMIPYGMKHYVVERPSFTDRTVDQMRMFLEAKNYTSKKRETISSALYIFDMNHESFTSPKEWIIESFVQWPHYEDDEWVLTTIRQKSVETFSSEINFIEIDFKRYFAEVPSRISLTFRRRFDQHLQRVSDCNLQRLPFYLQDAHVECDSEVEYPKSPRVWRDHRLQTTETTDCERFPRIDIECAVRGSAYER